MENVLPNEKTKDMNSGLTVEKRIENILRWAKVKAHIQANIPPMIFFEEREIWWANVGENLGSEQNGKDALFIRPVLIIKKFNQDLFLALSMTTKDKEGPYYIPTRNEPGQKSAKVVLSQVRTMSTKRLVKKQRTLPSEEFEAVREKLKEML